MPSARCHADQRRPPARSTSSTRPTSSSSAAGPGGLAAALAAARAGARTTLARSVSAASAATSPQVGVESIAWYRHEQTVDGDGIGIEFEDRATAMGAAIPESRSR